MSDTHHEVILLGLSEVGTAIPAGSQDGRDALHVAAEGVAVVGSDYQLHL